MIKGERSFIRKNWRKMTDETISHRLGLSIHAIKYYRMNYDMWKNRHGTSRAGQKAKAMRLYGSRCEICKLSIVELHHFIPRSNDPEHWSILCPLCHSLITKRLIKILEGKMTNNYEIKQLQIGYDIIRYDGSNRREAGKIQVTDEESMVELMDAMKKARMSFKVLIKNAPRPEDLEKLIERLLQ